MSRRPHNERAAVASLLAMAYPDQDDSMRRIESVEELSYVFAVLSFETSILAPLIAGGQETFYIHHPKSGLVSALPIRGNVITTAAIKDLVHECASYGVLPTYVKHNGTRWVIDPGPS